MLPGTQEMKASTYRLTGAQLDGDRHFAGDDIFRLSVGLEETQGMIEDLDRVLG